MNINQSTTLCSNGTTPQELTSYPEWFTITMSMFLIIEFVCGTVLNASVLIGGYSKHLKPNGGNYFIRTLNIVDVLICLITIPTTLAILVQYPYLNAFVCSFHESLISFSVTASAVCIFFVSIDRYLAIVTPTKRWLNANNIIYIKIIIIVLSGVGFAIPLFIMVFTTPSSLFSSKDMHGLVCRTYLLTLNPNFHYEVYFTTIYTLSVIIVTVAYFNIIKVARSRISIVTLIGNRAIRNTNIASKLKERKMFTLSAIIVSSFVICWGVYVFFAVLQLTLSSNSSLDMLRLCSLTVAMTTTSLHPLVYTFIHKDLRKPNSRRRITDTGSRTRSILIGSNRPAMFEESILNSASPGLSFGIKETLELQIFTTTNNSSDIGTNISKLQEKEKTTKVLTAKNQPTKSKSKSNNIQSSDDFFPDNQPSTSGWQKSSNRISTVDSVFDRFNENATSRASDSDS